MSEYINIKHEPPHFGSLTTAGSAELVSRIHYINYDPATENGNEVSPFKRSDLVQVVRCRECKDVHHRPNWQPDKRFKPQDLWLCEAEWCMGFEGDHPRVEPDGFCWRGERRES